MKIYAYLTHAGQVISAGSGPTRAAAAAQMVLAIPDAYGELLVASCRIRFFRSIV